MEATPLRIIQRSRAFVCCRYHLFYKHRAVPLVHVMFLDGATRTDCRRDSMTAVKGGADFAKIPSTHTLSNLAPPARLLELIYKDRKGK